MVLEHNNNNNINLMKKGLLNCHFLFKNFRACDVHTDYLMVGLSLGFYPQVTYLKSHKNNVEASE